MAAPYLNIRSKLSRSIAAYLISESAGSAADVFPSNSRAEKHFPVTICHIGNAPKVLAMQGGYQAEVFIRVRGAASENPGTTQYDLARKSFDERLAKTADVLVNSDDGDGSLQYVAAGITAAGRALKTDTNAAIAAANADMADFICDEWEHIGFGDGQPDDAGICWEEILHFKAIVRASNA